MDVLTIRLVNTIVRHHNRTVYSAQAIRHVAEQIDALYWAAGAPDKHEGQLEDAAISEETDLRDPEYESSIRLHIASC